MNLHIVPDNVFINKFYQNLCELGIEDNNRFVVRTNDKQLKYLKHPHVFAPLYKPEFDDLTGDTRSYQNVFIHQFTPLLLRWVAKHDFQQLHWIVWGSDIYNLPFVKTDLYEELTLDRYVNGKFSLKEFLYRAKVKMLHEGYRRNAYAKVNSVLTWMKSEYDFAIQHIPSLKAQHRFFFYENDLPYHALDEIVAADTSNAVNRKPMYIVGNSATPELNHLDAVALLNEQGIQADLCVPVSYGDQRYARFLKRSLGFYRGGEVRFMENYMTFQEYVKFLSGAEGLIMNNIRPQGYGNILMMMYLGKRIYLNHRNLSLPELDHAGLLWQPLKDLPLNPDINWSANRHVVTKHLSHDLLLETYRELFS